MKHKIIGSWFVAGILILLLPGLSRVASAGEINNAEQRVINAASETFSYQGKTYAVKSQYIAEGRNKLAEDGIDLSDADASSYIAQFHSSYEELVESGYCEEVGGQGGSDSDSAQKPDNGEKADSGQKTDSGKKDSGQKSDSGKSDNGKKSDSDQKDTDGQAGGNDASSSDGSASHSAAEKAKNQLFIRTVFGEAEEDPQNNSSKSDSSTSDGGSASGDSNGASGSSQGMAGDGSGGSQETAGDGSDGSQETAGEEADADWLEEEDLGTTVNFEESDLQAAKEQTLAVSGAGKHYQIQGQEQTDNMISQILHLKQWKIASIVILAVALCSALAVSWYIWAVLRHHHKKRKLRLGIAIAAGIGIAGCAFLFMLVMGMYFGVYNRDAIHRQLMESDYYSGITQMTRKLASEQLQEAGCDEGIAAEAFTLSHVYIEEKQYIDAVLTGQKDSAVSTENIQQVLEEQIPDALGEQKPVLVSSMTDLYQNTLQFALGEVISQSRQEFLPWCYGVAAASIILLLALLILTYQMYGYLHKSVRVCTAGILASSLLITGAALVLRIRHFAGNFRAEPLYYQQFIQKYAAWSVNVMLYVGCLGLLAAVAMTVWKRYLHMVYVE